MWKTAIFQALVDQSWWFLWLIWSIHVCWWISWWPEVPMGPSWTGNLAWKKFSQILLYAAYSIGDWGLDAPLNVNFLEFCLHFPNHLVKRNQKMLVEQGKVEKLCKWSTLMVIVLISSTTNFKTYGFSQRLQWNGIQIDWFANYQVKSIVIEHTLQKIILAPC